MSGQLHSMRAELLEVDRRVHELVDAPDLDRLADEPESFEHVWIADGLRLKWRVVSEVRSFGEWAVLADAIAFMHLLIDGNPDLRRLA